MIQKTMPTSNSLPPAPSSFSRADTAGLAQQLARRIFAAVFGEVPSHSVILRFSEGFEQLCGNADPAEVELLRYAVTRDGLLSSTRRVYIGDSASFPRLPAKNMSFGMMANAMRVAAIVAAHANEET
jgi:hypothetical protein